MYPEAYQLFTNPTWRDWRLTDAPAEANGQRTPSWWPLGRGRRNWQVWWSLYVLRSTPGCVARETTIQSRCVRSVEVYQGLTTLMWWMMIINIFLYITQNYFLKPISTAQMFVKFYIEFTLMIQTVSLYLQVYLLNSPIHGCQTVVLLWLHRIHNGYSKFINRFL